ALLFITHDLGLVAAVADDVLVLERGTQVETGDTLSVLDTPQAPYTRRLIGAAPTLPLVAPDNEVPWPCSYTSSSSAAAPVYRSSDSTPSRDARRANGRSVTATTASSSTSAAPGAWDPSRNTCASGTPQGPGSSESTTGNARSARPPRSSTTPSSSPLPGSTALPATGRLASQRWPAKAATSWSG